MNRCGLPADTYLCFSSGVSALKYEYSETYWYTLWLLIQSLLAGCTRCLHVGRVCTVKFLGVVWLFWVIRYLFCELMLSSRVRLIWDQILKNSKHIRSLLEIRSQESVIATWSQRLTTYVELFIAMAWLMTYMYICKVYMLVVNHGWLNNVAINGKG